MKEPFFAAKADVERASGKLVPSAIYISLVFKLLLNLLKIFSFVSYLSAPPSLSALGKVLAKSSVITPEPPIT